MNRQWKPKSYFERYDRERFPFASGGFGRVAVYFDSVLQKDVRVKRLHQQADESVEWIVRSLFVNEALVATYVQHPGIPPAFDIGVWPTIEVKPGRPADAGGNSEEADEDECVAGPSMPFFASEYLPNTKNFEDWLAAGPADDADKKLVKALVLFDDICRIVDFTHDKGFIHCDLKPKNILVEGTRARVIDWGVSAIRHDSPDRTKIEELRRKIAGNMGIKSLSPSVASVGTLPYMDLWLEPRIPWDRQADIYSLGMILRKIMLSVAQARKCPLERVEEWPAVPQGVSKELWKDLIAIVRMAIDPQRQQRYATAGQLAEEVNLALRKELVIARPLSPWGTLKKWMLRKPDLAAVIFITAIIVTSIALYTYQFYQEDVFSQALIEAQDGRWAASLKLLNGLHVYTGNPIALGIAKAKAYTILGQAEESAKELRRLEQRSDLGTNRGEVQFLMGEHQMFDAGPGAMQQALTNLQAALDSRQLSESDSFVAKGLMATSAPAALACMGRALDLDPRNHAAYRHYFGLRFLMPQREDAQTRYENFRVAYGDDPSIDILMAADFALAGNTNAASQLLNGSPEHGTNPTIQGMMSMLPDLAAIPALFDPDECIRSSKSDYGRLTNLQAILKSSMTNLAGKYLHSGTIRVPHLPCLDAGIYSFGRAWAAFDPYAQESEQDSIKDLVTATENSWRAQPDALFPVMAAIEIGKNADSQKKPDWISTNQFELFALAAESGSIIPNVPHFARMRACQEALRLQDQEPGSEAARSAGKTCIGILEHAANTELTAAEVQVLSEAASRLGRSDLTNSFEPQPAQPQPANSTKPNP